MEEHLDEDLEVVDPLEHIEFEIGDNVVYPHHGAGKVLRKENKDILGESREYLTIKILHNDMTVMVPTENAALAGLRRVIDEETVKKVLAVLQDECSEMPKNWNRRFKHNRDKIKTGDIYELAEVVRNLAIREAREGPLDGREADVHPRQEDPRLRADVCARDERGRGRGAPRRAARRSRPAQQGGGGREVGSRPRTEMAVALIVAAGRGERLGSGRPKALVTLAGRPMLEWSVAALRQVAAVTRDRGRAPGGRARRRAGGDRRRRGGRDALGVGAAALPAPAGGDPVIVHDAARPLAQPELFERALAELEQYAATRSIAAAPVSDTIKEVADDGRTVQSTLDRARLWAVQTPQVFRRAALERALAAPPTSCWPVATDDAWLVERAGGVVRVVAVRSGEPQDHHADRSARGRAAAAERGGERHERPRCRSPDSATTAIASPRAGGSCSAASRSRTSAASRATRTPTCSRTRSSTPCSARPRWGTSASTFRTPTSATGTRTRPTCCATRSRCSAAAGYAVVHVDATVVIERPKLAPARERIRETLARALGIDVAHVSVKATRGEGMGFVGREEGVAALAVATVVRDRDTPG